MIHLAIAWLAIIILSMEPNIQWGDAGTIGAVEAPGSAGVGASRSGQSEGPGHERPLRSDYFRMRSYRSALLAYATSSISQGVRHELQWIRRAQIGFASSEVMTQIGLML